MKVLIISHTCFSTYNNMGKTFCALFSQFASEELCQLYIYPSYPDVDICRSYYRVTDKEILGSYFRLHAPGGPVADACLQVGKPAAFARAADASIYQRRSNSAPSVRLLRDAMWKFSRWYTPQLRRWLDQEKPTCIFLAPGYAKLIYDIALKISREYGLPIVTYICDDYYFVKRPDTLAGRLQLRLLRRKMDRLMAQTRHLVAICEEIRDVYTERFGTDATVIMTGAAQRERVRHQDHDGEIRISYFGALRPNRECALSQFGQALDACNARHGMNCFLDVYTAEAEQTILSALEGIRSIRLHGFVSGEEHQNALQGTDFLLHAEAFDAESRELVRRSISTKIADSLASGIPLLAYGPEDIASMQHLIRNNCAFVAVSQQELGSMLETALFCPQTREEIVENALRAAGKYHDLQKNSLRLHALVQCVTADVGCDPGQADPISPGKPDGEKDHDGESKGVFTGCDST